MTDLLVMAAQMVLCWGGVFVVVSAVLAAIFSLADWLERKGEHGHQ